MAEVTTLAFEYKEVIEALIKKAGVNEGVWQLYVEFGLAGANIATGENIVSPSAIVPVKKIGIMRVEKENQLALDASKVNPATPKKSQKKK